MVRTANVPTTPGYACMLTGMDIFTTQCVALRHKGSLTRKTKTMAEVLRSNGYNTTCVGFTGNPSSRGFDTYLDYESWGSWNEGRSPKAQNLNEVAIPELGRLAAEHPRYPDVHAKHAAALYQAGRDEAALDGLARVGVILSGGNVDLDRLPW